MSTETIAERRARVRSTRLLERPLSLRDTITTLKYIGDVDQPEQDCGGFHEHTIRTARSALHHIERLRRRSNIPAETRPASGRSLQPIVGTERKER
jgi:hypothetical protein